MYKTQLTDIYISITKYLVLKLIGIWLEHDYKSQKVHFYVVIYSLKEYVKEEVY